MNRRTLCGYGLALSTVGTAGCITLPTDSQYEIDFDGRVEAASEGLELSGQIESDGVAAPDRDYRDVSVVLTDESGNVLDRERLGSISTNPDRYPNRVGVDISRPYLPEFVYFDSPDFWTGDVSVEYFGLVDGAYSVRYVTSRTRPF